MRGTSDSANVEVLVAEVRVLMVGNRQITLSIYRQLDRVAPDLMHPFGRVRAERGAGAGPRIEVVGAAWDGSLVASWVAHTTGGSHWYCPGGGGYEQESLADTWRLWEKLPLIVLAGLR